MKFLIEAHEAPNGDLLLSVSSGTQAVLQKFKAELGDAFSSSDTRFDVFAEFIESSDYSWISPEEIGAFIDAPILGVKASQDFGDIVRAWAFMGTGSPQDDLADKGRVRFTSGD